MIEDANVNSPDTIEEYFVMNGVHKKDLSLWIKWWRKTIDALEMMGAEKFVQRDRNDGTILSLGLTYGEKIEEPDINPVIREHAIVLDPPGNAIGYYKNGRNALLFSHIHDFYPSQGRVRIFHRDDAFPRHITETTISKKGLERVVVSKQVPRRPVFGLYFDHLHNTALYVDLVRKGVSVEIPSLNMVSVENGTWAIGGQREGVNQFLQVSPRGIHGFTQGSLEASA